MDMMCSSCYAETLQEAKNACFVQLSDWYAIIEIVS